MAVSAVPDCLLCMVLTVQEAKMKAKKADAWKERLNKQAEQQSAKQQK